MYKTPILFIMCLRTKMICPQRARKDIICYKVVTEYKNKSGNTAYVTPFLCADIELFSTMKAKENIKMAYISKMEYPITTKGGGVMYVKRINEYIVQEGYIHCYVHIDGAIRFKHHNSLNSYALKIIRCIIPKGTLYYKSTDKQEICAKQIFTIGIEL